MTSASESTSAATVRAMPAGPAANPSTEPIRISFKSVQTVEVTAENDDRFSTTVREAARACQAHENQKNWAQIFNELLAELYAWSTARTEVSSCFVTWGEGGIRVFVVTLGQRYHFEFDDQITDLNLRLAQIYPDHPADVLQIPTGQPDSIRNFFTPERCIQVYG